jgi:hypothetical protein
LEAHDEEKDETMNQLWGPALEAELEYRRERAAQAYGTPPWWTWLRTRSASRTTSRTMDRSGGRRPERARPAPPAARWEARVARRAAEIGEGLEALRLHQEHGRRVA